LLDEEPAVSFNQEMKVSRVKVSGREPELPLAGEDVALGVEPVGRVTVGVALAAGVTTGAEVTTGAVEEEGVGELEGLEGLDGPEPEPDPPTVKSTQDS
jgi:hypothetical protein